MADLKEPHTNHILTGVTRAFDTPFQIDATYEALVAYTIEMNVQAPLLSTQQVTVSLLVEGANPPTTEVASTHLESGQLAGLGLVSVATGARQVMVCQVPAGAWVMISKTAGAGSASIVGQLEVVYNDSAF